MKRLHTWNLQVDIFESDEVKLDLQPIYQCLHIYDELGQRAEFKQSYAEDRRAQAKLALSSVTSPFNLKECNTDNFKSLLHDIVGFFIVEHIVMYSTTNFRTQAQVGIRIVWQSKRVQRQRPCVIDVFLY
jgi:hypothetical protein